MRIEYILLSAVFLLPFIYKIMKWKSIFSTHKKQSFKQIIFAGYDFWMYIEIPLLVLAIMFYFNPLIEIFVFNIYFYFWILYSIFVLGKIYRKKIHLFKNIRSVLFWIILLLFSWMLGVYFFKNIYIVMMWCMLLFPFGIILYTRTK